ncbi:MAG: hypothetical protein BM562_16130 [Alphaproteobacteria bacterium MedPE-SWcel]|nr:MAG: hypothetical protein BM562_16130 [Alphaproteobacteria bacterium MedPE-SWcel]
MAALHDKLGPELPSTHYAVAALQLHQNGHSSMAQHFRRMKVGRAGLSYPLRQHDIFNLRQ